MILPPAMLGMLGGGQLGRFFVLAAHEMGYRVTVLDPDPYSPAGRLADQHLIAAYDDADALERIGQTCAAVTTEFENVPAPVLDSLAKFVPVHPAAACVAIAQNRIAEKSFLSSRGFPVGPYAAIRNADDIARADPSLFPAVLKVSRFGYDGKGQTRVWGLADAKAAFHHFGDEPCVLETFLPLECELSCVVARTETQELAAFPVAENRHRHGILDISIVPARPSSALRVQAEEAATALAADMAYIGVIGVEFFVSGGSLLVNEIAPRPHNSAHYTLDACLASQFEQQVRALCGLPLGDARAHNAAVMVNLLGDLWHVGEPDWSLLLGEAGLKLHLYGKRHARPGRKMGHFTLVGSDPARTLEAALAARARIGIGD